MCVFVRGHLQRDALVHGVGTAQAVELGAHHLEHVEAALGGERERLFDPVIHVDARREVQSGCRDLRPQRFDDRVAAGHDLTVVALGPLRTARSTRSARSRSSAAGGTRPAVPLARLVEPLLGGLALAGDVPTAVLGLRGRALALEGAAVVPARADRRPLLLRLAGCSGARWFCHYAMLQWVEPLASSSTMPAAVSSSRMRSAAAKSLPSRARARSSMSRWTRLPSAAEAAPS